jgi:hypothetical protein
MDTETALDRVQDKDRYQQRTIGDKRTPTVPVVPVAGTSDVVQVVPSRCPYCGRTRWQPVTVLQDEPVAGLSPAGYPCTHVVRQRCRCDHCGGTFSQTSYEQRTLPGQSPGG